MQSPADQNENRMIALMRFVFAVSVWGIFALDPDEPKPSLPYTFLVLVLYCGYSAIAERAEALGGQTQVEPGLDGVTTVTVVVPL